MNQSEPHEKRGNPHFMRSSMAGIPSAYRLFFQESMRSLGPTASLFPSSRYLANALIRPIDFRRARTVVELGPGTGAVTNAILKRLRPDAKLIAVDINRTFIHHLQTACHDPRLIPVCGDAADLQAQLAQHEAGPVDAIVSSLGLTAMDNRTRRSIMREIGICLIPGGTMTQYQYLGNLDIPKFRIRGFNEARFLRRFFSDVTVGHVIWNVPPAMVFTCRK
jgi:phosphatidylethanolamine/phosphatidyl-N-methylethanolamine N-methyltransferase